MPQRIRDLSGQRFGRWTVTDCGGQDERLQARWLCRCDCGTLGIVVGQELVQGSSRSCGCLRRELSRAAHTIHGYARPGHEHPLYHLWHTMHQRCTNLRSRMAKYYGLLGVRVCERWRDFPTFLADVGERPTPQHTLDRIDPYGHYEPGNIRWATPKEQANNRRNSRHRRPPVCDASP